MAEKRWMKITVTAYVPIDEDELAEGYEADSFEQAVENQRAWIDGDESSVIELVANGYHGSDNVELMPVDFDPTK